MYELDIPVTLDLSDLTAEAVLEDSQPPMDINILAMSVFNDSQAERLRNLYSIGKGIRNIRIIPVCDKYGISYSYHDGLVSFTDTVDGDYRFIYTNHDLDPSDRYFDELTSLFQLLDHCYVGKTDDGKEFVSESIGLFVDSYDPFEAAI